MTTLNDYPLDKTKEDDDIDISSDNEVSHGDIPEELKKIWKNKKLRYSILVVLFLMFLMLLVFFNYPIWVGMIIGSVLCFCLGCLIGLFLK